MIAQLFISKVFPAVAGVTMGAGGVFIGALDKIDEHTLIPLSVFASGIFVMVSAAYWLGKKIQNVDDRLRGLERDVDEIKKHCPCK